MTTATTTSTSPRSSSSDDGSTPVHVARTRHSRRSDGDFRIDGDTGGLASRREALAPGAWTWLRQVHGTEVVVVEGPGDHAGAEADAAVTTVPGAVLAVHTADCVPILLHDPEEGVVAAVHAGWRGLGAGILERTASVMQDLGGRPRWALVGPHIRGRCYEFGQAELDLVARRYGDAVRTTTAWGTPGLDLTTAVGAALGELGVAATFQDGCTACQPEDFYSHRARGDTGRHAAVISLDP